MWWFCCCNKQHCAPSHSLKMAHLAHAVATNALRVENTEKKVLHVHIFVCGHRKWAVLILKNMLKDAMLDMG